MANNQRLIIGIAVAAVVIAIIVIAGLLISSGSTPSPTSTSVAILVSPSVSQDDDTERTKIYAELTSTAIILAVTNQAGTLASMQQTINAPKDTVQPQVVTAAP